ncbi:male-specific lethal 1 homolog [Tribolium madens]|uniref:male-specific lethal 1 homolog n=1 Tax=Tribolium madens TaxID=41895 RepID=UPI001CF71DA0|nr:male-specific lethal 1 homolog [Tribolium madens]
MPISRNNDQNIKRLCAKMSENFPDECKSKLSKLPDSTSYLAQSVDKNDLNFAYDHMYASNTENGEINTTITEDANCQSAESEVKFWKEWLILHLDLIQQQSDEILNKERTILILQQENEMLKERISCMERGAPFHPNKFYNNHSTSFLDEGLDMTQDSSVCDEDNKNCLDLLDLNCENGTCPPLKLAKFEENSRSDGESQTGKPSIDNKFDSQVNYHKISDKLKSESEIADCNSTSAGFDFTVNSSDEFDPMRNLRMSIRRKRLSNSSAVSNNDSVLEEKRSFRKFKKRRKRVLKDSQILTTTDQYITEAGRTNLRLSNVTDLQEIPNNTNLEVPRWRVKVYASCYAMEGTENLDDEVFNKRHSRLENDERRRKRWDVQRIREQRVIEKLKQRQERLGSGSRTDEQTDSVLSLWPTLENIKYLEVSDQLPVSAFGSPIPKIAPSEFNLPWLSNPSLITSKKGSTKRTTLRRKNSRR